MFLAFDPQWGIGTGGWSKTVTTCSLASENTNYGEVRTAEFARRVQEGFLPLMREMPGFQGYYLLDGGSDVIIAISMFNSADEALASNETAADWVRNNVLEFTKGLPEVMVGDSLISEVK